MFTGFTPATIDFMWNIRFYNERAWFEQHKEEYRQVLARTDALLTGFAAALLSQAAHGALLAEVRATPKPGLVDQRNNGAHGDMDLPLFEKSAASLRPYFSDAVRLGLSDAGMAPLRAAGLLGEQAMFSATGGVNTHKGMVYSMGLLLYGMGRALQTGADAMESAALLVRGEAGADSGRAAGAPLTHGETACLAHGVRGARGEAADGFPHAILAKARLQRYRASGVENPEALALCDLMATLDDTNLLHRGGAAGLRLVQREAARIAALPEAQREGALLAMDDVLIEKNLSPGGSADMLALGLLLEQWDALKKDLF